MTNSLPVQGLVLVMWALSCFACPHWYRKGYWHMDPYTKTLNICSYDRESYQKTPDGIRNNTEYLQLRYNNLSNEHLNMSLIRDQVPALVAISLSFNSLTQVPDFSLWSSTLTYISLESNDLHCLNFNDFIGLVVLRTLQVKENLLASSIHSITAVNQPDLCGNNMAATTTPSTTQYDDEPTESTATVAVQLLYLNKNPLQHIDLNIFANMPRLYRLDLREAVCDEFISMPNKTDAVVMEQIYVGLCGIFQQSIIWKNLPNLINISMTGEKMSILDFNSFASVHSTLGSIDVGENSISTILQSEDNDIFGALEILRLDYNSFNNSFDLSIFNSSQFPKLSDINLSHNKIVNLNISSNIILTSLTGFDLTNNILTFLDLGLFIMATPKLISLKCSNNHITKVIAPTDGSYLNSLRDIYLDNNPLKTIDPYCPPSYYHLHLASTDLHCDSCLYWLYTCQDVQLTEFTQCQSPSQVAGKEITEAGPEMADIICPASCDPSPCQNGGTCEVNGEGHTCACDSRYTGTNCETAGDDFLYWTASFSGQACPWDSGDTSCAKCRAGGVQCPYHTSPNVCVMDGEYAQNRFCCHSLGIISTCDNKLWLYADGEEIGHVSVWTEPIFRQVNSDISVIGIQCLDTGAAAGVLASFSDGTYTSTSTWSCSTVATEGWKEPGFNLTSDWQIPGLVGVHPVSPWGTIAGVSYSAQWIWEENASQSFNGQRTLYCRTVIDWGTDQCQNEVDDTVGTMPVTTTTPTKTTSSANMGASFTLQKPVTFTPDVEVGAPRGLLECASIVYSYQAKSFTYRSDSLTCHDCAKVGCEKFIAEHPKWTGKCDVDRGEGKCFIRKDPNNRLYWGCIDDIYWPDVPWRKFNGCTEDWDRSWEYRGRRKPIVWCICEEDECNVSIEQLNRTQPISPTNRPTTPEGKEGDDNEEMCNSGNIRSCDHNCDVINGRVQCSCNPGFVLQADGRSCADRNECLSQNGGCSQICYNVIGSYSCTCRQGYRLHDDRRTCIDTNECLVSNGGCSHICENRRGSYRCACPTGYTLDTDNHSCKDIDECTSQAGLCSHLCTNTPGSFLCSCLAGYEIGTDGRTCHDLNECVTESHRCDGLCTNTIGSYTCGCGLGFVLSREGAGCQDIDECTLDSHVCAQVCVNTHGSYLCECHPGFTLNLDSKTCIDINECLQPGQGGCDQGCVNTQGSYYCTCNPGYRLNDDGLSCIDIDECAFGSPLCDQLCVNIPGSYTCTCFDGYEISPAADTCIDVNECLYNNGGCSDICSNSEGSYSCACDPDPLYSLGPDLKTCTAQCPPDLLASYTSGSCYKIFSPSLQNKDAAKNFYEAERECQKLHPLGHLVKIEDATEKEFLSAHIRNNPFMLDGWQGWWTAAKFQGDVKEFTWTPDSQLIVKNHPLWSFKKQPYEDTCLWVMQEAAYDYTWGNFECVTKSGYICEINLPKS